MRSDLPGCCQSVRGEAQPLEPVSGATLDVLDALREHGASSRATSSRSRAGCRARSRTRCGTVLRAGCSPPTGFSAVRRLLVSRRLGRSQGITAGSATASAATRPAKGGGRSSRGCRRSSRARCARGGDRRAVLVRWGVVFRDVVARETIALPWRDVVWALRRMEARGTARGGRFVTGFAGEQFALPEAVDQLRSVRRRERSAEVDARVRDRPAQCRRHPASGSARHFDSHATPSFSRMGCRSRSRVRSLRLRGALTP